MKSFMVAIGNFFFHHRNVAFPALVVALFLIAVSPHQLFGSMFYEDVKDVFALLIALCGLAVRGVVVGHSYVKRAGLSKNIHANQLVTHGMFSLCRNPLYLGNMLIYIGVFIMHGDLVVMTLGIALYFFIYQCIILAEEAYITKMFGEAYSAYCREVPRWIPRRLHYDVTEDMQFDMRRVIMTEYSVMTSTMVTLTVVLFYEHLGLPSMEGHWGHMLLLGLALLGTIAMAITIRTWKKRSPRTA